MSNNHGKLDKIKEAYSFNGITGVRQIIQDSLSYKYREWRDYPEAIMVEPSFKCNLRCAFCWIVQADLGKNRKFLPLEEYKKFVDDLNGRCRVICFSSRGEPTLCKDIFKMISYTKNVRTAMSTNGTTLNADRIEELLDSGLDDLTISFDGAKKETYEQIRVGAKYERVIKNIEIMVNRKAAKGLKTPVLEMQMIITKKNANEVEDYIKMCRNLGVDRVFFKTLYIAQMNNDYVNGVLGDLFIDNEMSSYNINEQERPEIRDKPPCLVRQTPVINSNGDVSLCCYDIYCKYTFGNIREKNFMDIWRDYKDFRMNKMFPRKLPICQQCDISSAVQNKSVEFTTNKTCY